MKKIINLLDDECVFPPLEDIGYEFIPSEEEECDVLVCGLEYIDYAGVMINPRESFFIIALDNPDKQKHLVPNTFHVWIDKKKLEDLPKLLKEYSNFIDEKRAFRELNNTLKRFVVDTSTHDANLDGIKLSMRESTGEIEKIFEERVEEMRAIHRDALTTHEKLSALKVHTAPKEFGELEESWNTTQSILSRTNDVIIAMFEFITILQCEDRITQMIDGISKIMKDDISNATKNGCIVSSEEETKLKERLVPFYTIQEQRDYANGSEYAMLECGCSPDQAAIDEFTLF